MDFLQSVWYQILWFFTIYSFLGWCVEVCFCSIVTRKWVNRGFLNGPVCPIYGFGMLIIVTTLTPLKHNPILLFLGAMILCSVLELVTGYVLKKLFHTSWWDYSDEKFQIGGYICLKFSIMWGLGGMAALYILHPVVEKIVTAAQNRFGLVLLILCMVLFVADGIVTLNTIAKLNRNLGEITRLTKLLHSTSDTIAENLGENALSAYDKYEEKKAEFSQKKEALSDTAQTRYAELTNKVNALRAELQEAKMFGTARLIKAFPKIKSNQYAEALEEIRKYFHRKK